MEIDDYLNKMIAEGKKEIITEYIPTDILRVIDIKEQPFSAEGHSGLYILFAWRLTLNFHDN